MALTAFTSRLGRGQGRLATSKATGGNYAFVLGDAEPGRTVRAAATVAWGVPRSAVVAPLAISHCEYERAGGVVGSTLPPPGSRTVEFHTSSSGGCVSSSGAALPGGFGWLTPDGSRCAITLEIGIWQPVATGASAPSRCDPADWVGTTIVLPVFVGSNGLSGSNGVLQIGGWVGFAVTAVKFPGATAPKGTSCPSGGSANCLVGEFRAVEVTGGGPGFADPGSDYGARVIRLVR